MIPIVIGIVAVKFLVGFVGVHEYNLVHRMLACCRATAVERVVNAQHLALSGYTSCPSVSEWVSSSGVVDMAML